MEHRMDDTNKYNANPLALKDLEPLELSNSAEGTIIYYIHFGNLVITTKSKHAFTLCLSNCPLTYIPMSSECLCSPKTQIRMSIAALSSIAKIGKNNIHYQ